MSSEAILEYPALFEPSKIYDIDDLALEYIDMYEKYKGKDSTLGNLRKHVSNFLHTGIHGMGSHRDLRKKLTWDIDIPSESLGVDGIREIVQDMKERRKDIEPLQKLSWYFRHWKDKAGNYVKLAMGGL